jgi:hypothetical protein
VALGPVGKGLNGQTLRAVGLSANKAASLRDLATKVRARPVVLASVAGVSKRTLFKLFPGKDQLSPPTSGRPAGTSAPTSATCYAATSLHGNGCSPCSAGPRASAPFHGCPFHNAAIELADPDHPARPVVLAHKQTVVRLLVDTARQADATPRRSATS